MWMIHTSMYVDLHKVPDYTGVHLVSWLKYCGDTLKQLGSMKDIRNYLS